MSVLNHLALSVVPGQEKPAADSEHGKFVAMGAATITGHMVDGVVRLNAPAQWKEGQIVLVVPLDALPTSDEAPPVDLLEQDAAEFAPRNDLLRAASEDDLR